MSENETRKIFSENLKYYMERTGMNQADISRLLGVSESAVGKWILCKSTPRMGVIERLAKHFGINKSDLLEPRPKLPANCRPVTTHRIPMLGNIACGRPIFAEQDFEYTLELGDSINADFCLRATGDSMTGDRINDGDIVFIRQQPTVDNGQIAAVLIDDSATLKHVYYNKAAATLQLVASNPAHPPQIYSGQELENIRILGLAVAFMSPLA